jgi:diaminohydroxyphosphoribosylaminopyrimidine deaminase/5-amino-6-(5-phosphoribosylamino)uracil reductase
MGVSTCNAFSRIPTPVRLDRYFMARALELAERARGNTGDNPHVGSVIVLGERILGEGWTGEPGQSHAEANALLAAARAGHDVRGATLYATLEPCSFVGRTPACALAIVASGITRVVYGIRDPHPRVNGEGAQQLRRGGLEVSEGECAAEIRASLAEWLRSHPSAR